MTDILIVDDELGIRNILSEILGEQGYRVATAANVAEAKKAVTGQHYDLILLDIWMPDGDGLTLLREWKYSGALTFPVIVMSGHGSLDHAKRAIEDGAIDFIEKPISLKLLLSGIKNGLAKWSDRQKQLDEDRTRDRRMRRRANNSGPRPALPAFDIRNMVSLLISTDHFATCSTILSVPISAPCSNISITLWLTLHDMQGWNVLISTARSVCSVSTLKPCVRRHVRHHTIRQP